MKTTTMGLMAALLCAATGVRAEDDEAGNTEATETAEAAAAPGATNGVQKAQVAFTTLPFCRRVEGEADVLVPKAAEWAPVEEGRFYPLGTSYRTRGAGKLTIAFAKDCTAVISGEASFGTRGQILGEKSRTVVLQQGTLELSLAHGLPEGAFFVVAPGFRVKNLAGDSKFVYRTLGDGDEAVVRCVTGTLAVDGRHFEIPQMRAANEFRIRSNHDNLDTLIYGNSGDYVIRLDRGLATHAEVGEDGMVKQVTEPGTLDWHLSPETHVQIDRAMPSIGERMSVSVITFDAVGEPRNNYAFAEGRAEVNSGELIKPPKESGEEIAKRAAAAEETTAAAEEETTSAEESAGSTETPSDGE